MFPQEWDVYLARRHCTDDRICFYGEEVVRPIIRQTIMKKYVLEEKERVRKIEI